MEKLTKKSLEALVSSMSPDEAISYIESIQENTHFQTDTLFKKIMKKKDAILKEHERLEKMLHFEKQAYQKGFFTIAGVDEAGRGPLAGPVVAAAVILEPYKTLMGLNDSKKLTPLKREQLFDEINKSALCVSIALSTSEEIDATNILISTKKAMKTAILSLSLTPQMVLVDYENIEGLTKPQLSIVKGDALSLSIAAASVIAKVTRDRIMTDFSQQYPQYGFDKHKGYGTKDHIIAIKKYGICPIHRISFTKNFL